MLLSVCTVTVDLMVMYEDSKGCYPPESFTGSSSCCVSGLEQQWVPGMDEDHGLLAAQGAVVKDILANGLTPVPCVCRVRHMTAPVPSLRAAQSQSSQTVPKKRCLLQDRAGVKKKQKTSHESNSGNQVRHLPQDKEEEKKKKKKAKSMSGDRDQSPQGYEDVLVPKVQKREQKKPRETIKADSTHTHTHTHTCTREH
ncbi:hypothetical protein SCHPADRAFT_896824 [Schizopora paradoxa]|uniref:Uncharacterized protein n=1 Tax=Schizopora paradoxa TaxID=27342 RepID=A0A0H2R5F3_9AGAM|nr:hypothetical protein SCHPADRAFT_896824 [Schizopora paradoxa]